MNSKPSRYSSIIHLPLSRTGANKLETAFEAGRQGFTAGDENPHELDSVIYHVWNIGHTSAELDADTMAATHASYTAALDARC